VAKTIGILSDTHLRTPDRHLIALLDGPFCKVDAIIHLGDMVSNEVYDFLRKKELMAVAGNRDEESLKAFLPKKQVLSMGGFKIGIIHGWGAFWGILNRVGKEFQGVDAILFGHTHRPLIKYLNGILCLNPGSFKRDPLGGFHKRYAILRIGKELEPELRSL